MTDIESEARAAAEAWGRTVPIGPESAPIQSFVAGYLAALASRVSTPPTDELERLRVWKAEAMEVLNRWERVWEAAGRPGRLGRSKADNVREWIEAGAVSTPPSEEADEIRAEAVRETRRYIDRIHRNGLVPLGTVLADMEAAANRMEQGMTARGSTRRPPVPAIPVLPTEVEGTIDVLASDIRSVDHSLGAGELAEELFSLGWRRPAVPVLPTEPEEQS